MVLFSLFYLLIIAPRSLVAPFYVMLSSLLSFIAHFIRSSLFSLSSSLSSSLSLVTMFLAFPYSYRSLLAHSILPSFLYLSPLSLLAHLSFSRLSLSFIVIVIRSSLISFALLVIRFYSPFITVRRSFIAPLSFLFSILGLIILIITRSTLLFVPHNISLVLITVHRSFHSLFSSLFLVFSYRSLLAHSILSSLLSSSYRSSFLIIRQSLIIYRSSLLYCYLFTVHRSFHSLFSLFSYLYYYYSRLLYCHQLLTYPINHCINDKLIYYLINPHYLIELAFRLSLPFYVIYYRYLLLVLFVHSSQILAHIMLTIILILLLAPLFSPLYCFYRFSFMLLLIIARHYVPRFQLLCLSFIAHFIRSSLSFIVRLLFIVVIYRSLFSLLSSLYQLSLSLFITYYRSSLIYHSLVSIYIIVRRSFIAPLLFVIIYLFFLFISLCYLSRSSLISFALLFSLLLFLLIVSIYFTVHRSFHSLFSFYSLSYRSSLISFALLLLSLVTMFLAFFSVYQLLFLAHLSFARLYLRLSLVTMFLALFLFIILLIAITFLLLLIARSSLIIIVIFTFIVSYLILTSPYRSFLAHSTFSTSINTYIMHSYLQIVN